MNRGWILALGLVAANACVAACGVDVGNGGTARTEAALVPTGAPVVRSDSHDFTVNGRTVRLSHVEYGQQMDCASGCFASHVCAIEDDNGVQLYYASWTRAEERPTNMDAICPGLTGSETFPSCTPPGRSNPVVATTEFQSFKTAQIGAGPFRWCFNRER